MAPNRISLHDKSFEINIPEKEILAAIRQVAAGINADYKDKKPLFLAILNGAFMFASDLMKETNLDCEISFLRVSSYQDMHSTGQVSEVIGLKEDIKGRHIVILEDIVDTGQTVYALLQNLIAREPASIEIAALLLKPDCVQHPLQVKYIGLTIPNDFVVGYGLDYNGLGRNLRNIYKVL
ncbi:hypoxanthine phosphoribosyltransferase [Adhaeribacter rhizoryzae]|uniref:Hypoxanthine phosphoribosyltransferase n=1 Tax=Adhaeribacter rhizoryzae TaxID=2607907 RepID=A0A5M6DSC2_9BACT|nr:hypoxanthine phosphoribosyltransferase [Adhaeribacter rhizoryzae]KAA5548305.1 hypoxanthine phosphoribosyltransferase [Adhaeribacter rhizoryzae]